MELLMRAHTYQMKVERKYKFIDPSGVAIFAGTDLQPWVDFTLTGGNIIHGDHKSPNPFNYTVEYNQHLQGDKAGTVSSDGWATIENQMMSPFAWSLSIPENNSDEIYNRALNALNDKVRGGLDLAVDIAQTGQTVRMARDVAKFNNIVYGWGYKKWASRWLELQYGWKPLVSSIFGCADQLVRYANNELVTLQGRAAVHLPDPDPVFLWDTKIGVGQRIYHKGRQSCNISATMVDSTFNIARWSSLNPLSIAWELVPYSFVADWFYDVGSTIRNLETALAFGGDFKHGYISELYTYSATYKVEFARLGLLQTTSYTDVYAKIKATQFRRSVMSTYPCPRYPSINLDLGSSQLLNAAALLVNFFQKR
jgi:hypothetical protein